MPDKQTSHTVSNVARLFYSLDAYGTDCKSALAGVYLTPDFKKSFKKLYKKHPSLKADLKELIDTLTESPNTGIHLGHDVYKIRLAITSKGKGKSGGARIITYLVTEDNELYLVFIYDKSQLENITKEQIFEMLKNAELLK